MDKIVNSNDIDNPDSKVKLPIYAKIIKAVKLYNDGINKTNICKQVKMNITTLNKILEVYKTDTIESYKNSVAELKHQERSVIILVK